MRLLCLDQFSELGGAQRSLLDLLPGFAENGWQTDIFLPGAGAFATALAAQGRSVAFYSTGTYSNGRKPAREMAAYALGWPRLVYQIHETVLATKPSLLYVNGPRVLPAAAFVARFHRLPLIFHSHNRLVQRAALSATEVALRVAAAHLIACCEYVAEPFRRRVAEEKLSIIYNGVSRPTALRRFRSPLRRIGVLGRIEPEKGQLHFVRAARNLATDFPGCTFEVIGAPLFSGDDYYSTVRREAAGLRIEFPGWQADPAAALARLDLLVVPSERIEATTRVILEAYAAGVPVVAFPSGGIREIVLDQQTGFLATNHTPEALAARISFALRLPPSRLRSILKNANDVWRSRYTLGRYRDQVCAVISSVLGETETAAAYTAARIAR